MGLLILLWIAWCTCHSLLITAPVRRWFEARGGAWAGGYRLGYVVFSLATLAPLVWYGQILPQTRLGYSLSWIQVGQGLLFVYALVLFVGGTRVHDLRSFLGLEQWRAYRAGRRIAPPVLKTTGILAHVRHPWYGGGIALLWAIPGLTDVSLIVRTLLTAYLVIGALLEERKLTAVFGETYLAYRQRTPMLFPWRLRSRTKA
jgi:protein-S-isoprenylcysteine O-methyltransferase Ste14